MKRITHVVSDSQLKQELLYFLKRRELEQKFVYLWDGAEKYYTAISDTDNVQRNDNNRINPKDFFLSNISEKVAGKKFSIVSLGCGNACQEKNLLAHLVASGVDFSYVGVDCSKLMIEYAIENLGDINGLDASFYCADFTTDDFLNQIRDFTKKYEHNVFSFLGRTFGNTNQTSMTDTLYNILGPKDLLWLDALSRNKNDKTIKFKLFNRYSGYISNQGIIQFEQTPLREVGIPKESGKMVLESYEEPSVGSIVFIFSFVFTQKTVVTYKGEVIHFLPEEKLNLLTIRNYESNRLKSFFKEHNFKLLFHESGKIDGRLEECHLLFKKN